ncbi:MAG TPA: glycosyltransferase family 39 protein [Bacteroidia bacterium]|jgi:4-amino-4-deoxy-L-arabinose transferase-like glycosyltransferase|nr:glycosyltransferase family 39 protein [Bacteroidia bacterium]
MGRKKHIYFHLAITIISALLFIPFLGAVHLFDWDEINFAECAREMLASGDYSNVQLNFRPFWEKPPLFIWLQALSMNIFGVNEFAARFPDAVCGILTLNLIYYFGRKFNDHKFALLWVFSFGASFLPFLYFKSGIIDPWFNLLIFLSICSLLAWFNNNVSGKINRNAIYAGIFAGLAVLTKGPAALIIIGLCVLLSWQRLRYNPFANIKNLLLFIFATLLSGFSWFLFEIITGHYDIVKEFITYQVRLLKTEDSGHGGFLLYHFVVLLIGCFPASVFFIASHKKNPTDTPYQVYVKKWMLSLFWVVLILYTVVVQTKIVHYSSMCYFPLTYLAAHSLYQIVTGEKKLGRVLFIIGIAISTMAGIAFTLITFIEPFKAGIISSGLVKDDFALACLNTPVKWGGYEWITGIFFLAGSICFLTGLYRTGKASMAYGLLTTSLISVWLLTVTIVPKVEPYSQGPAIEFYQSLKDKDCYVETIGFKSYAYLFYTGRKPSHNSPKMLAFIKKQEKAYAEQGFPITTSFNLASCQWMMWQEIDKPAYFVAKITEEAQIKKGSSHLTELYKKGGFVFFKREPEKP